MSPATKYSLFPSSRSSAIGDTATNDRQSNGAATDSTAPEEQETTSSSHQQHRAVENVGRESALTLVNEEPAAEDLSELVEPKPTVTASKKAPPPSIALDQPQTMRSMFPTYDTERALNEQYYLPSQMSPSCLPLEAVCKSPYSAAFNVEDTVVEKDVEKSGLLFKPVNHSADDGFTPEWELPGLWNLSSSDGVRSAAQQYRLQVHYAEAVKQKRQSKWRKSRLPSSQRVLSFGASASTPFISTMSGPATTFTDSGVNRTPYIISRHGINRFSSGRDDLLGPSEGLTDFTLKQQGIERILPIAPLELENGIEVITTFLPHRANSDGSVSKMISHFPNMEAEEEVNLESERQRCYIVLRTYPGQRRPCYALKHPNLGFMRLKVHGDVRLPDTAEDTDNRTPAIGKIELLAPIRDDHFDAEEVTDSLYAIGTVQIAEPEIVLASIDLATSTLFLDGAGLADVNEPFLVDVTISSLVAVLLSETNSPRLSQQLSFAPPPLMEVGLQRKTSKLMPLMRSNKPKRVSKKQKAEDEMEQTLSAMFGMVALALGFAVDRLAVLNEKVKT